jgi:MoaA/NifB/PqqE/SkfB family radical SAM enzyme
MDKFFFNIDVLGTCNLRCPSCPVGNTKDYKLPMGYMSPETLKAILQKAQSECEVTGVGLFNWTEPILHPRLPELIRIVTEFGYSSYLSSNLNYLKNIDAIMAANPYSFRISNSGFTQDVYGYTHRGGDIEKVKKNMVELAAAKKRNNATTNIHVLYHRYKGNLEDEIKMKEFAESLGFGFQPVWAFFMALEKILAYDLKDPSISTITEEDEKLVDYLALPLKEAMEVSRKYSDSACTLQDSQITMDYQGNVQLCCATYDARKFTIASYLDTPISTIQKSKKSHSFCGTCSKAGGHVYVTYGATELEEIARRNIGPEKVKLLDLDYEIKQKKLRRNLEWVYQKAFSSFISPEQSAVLGRQYDRIQRGVRKVTKTVLK